MNQPTLAFPEVLWDELIASLAESRESAALVVARIASTGDHMTLLARRVTWMRPEDYLRRDHDGLEISSDGLMHALKTAVLDRSVAVFFHTHPRVIAAEHSERDHEVNRRL